MGPVRAWFLASGRSPRVILKDASAVRTLVYTCTAKDNMRGVVCVHIMLPEFREIQAWLEHLDLGLKYWSALASDFCAGVTAAN